MSEEMASNNPEVKIPQHPAYQQGIREAIEIVEGWLRDMIDDGTLGNILDELREKLEE